MLRARLAVFVVLITALCSNCAAGSNSKSDTAPRSATSDEAIIRQYVLTADAPFVLRAQPGQWSSVQPYFRELMKAGPSRGRQHQMLADFVDEGPLPLIFEAADIPYDGSSAPDGTVWMTAYVAGGEPAVRAASVGTTWLPSAEDPQAFVVRALVPSAEPEKTATKLENALGEDRAAESFHVEPHGHFVLVDVATVRHDLKGDPPSTLWKKAAKAAAGRQTPALEQFWASDAPLGLYWRTQPLHDFGVAEVAFDAGEASRMATPENRLQMKSSGASTMLGLELIGPPAQRELEDVAVLVHAQGDQGLGADIIATRTAHGRAVFEASAAGVDLAKINPKGLPDDRMLVDLRLSADIAKLADAMPVELSERKINRDRLAAMLVNPRSLMGASRVARNALGQSGWAGLAVLVQSPTYLLRAAVSQVTDDARGLVPVAMRLRLASPADDADNPMGIDAALVIRFRASKQTLDETLAQADLTPQAAQRFGASFRTVGTESGGAELQVAVGAPVEKFVLDQRGPLERGLRVDVGDAPEKRAGKLARLLGLVAPLHLRSRPSSTVARWTLVSRASAPEVTQLDAKTPLLENDEACTETLVKQGLELFKARMRLSYEATLAEVHTLLESYDRAAEACAAKHPDLAKELAWARGRARWQLASKWAGGSLPYVADRVAACRDQADRAACDYLQRRYEAGDYPAALEQSHEVASGLLEEACEMGDQVACQQAEELPTLETLRWRPDATQASK